MANPPHPLVLRGREALARGDLSATAAAAEERLRSDARDVQALELRFMVQHRRGELARAVETLQTVIGIAPGADWAYNDLINLLFTAGRRSDAEQVARTALRVNPRNVTAHELFGTILSELNDLPSGEWHFRRAAELGGSQPRCLANLALNLLRQGRTQEADALFARAEALAPSDVKTLAHWSKLHEVTGDLTRAGELLDRAEAASSPSEVNLLRANHLTRSGRPEEALAIFEAAPTLGGDGQLERGRLYERLGRFDDAWRDFLEAKKKLAAEGGGLQYQTEAVETFFARLKRFFVRANLELLPRATARRDAPQPIFIMGYPRSGTTMIEQVLCSHSAVLAGGELAFMTEIRRLAKLLFPGSEPFPENLAQTWTADNRYAATLFRDYYLARAEQYRLFEPGKAFFTDKMPFNEIWLPLIRMAFPEARIVRVIRHPLDVCVSMLSNNLTHGFNCAYGIESIVHHLAAVFDLSEHYRRELDSGELLFKYESFVADPLTATRRLLEHAGVPYEDACLRFYENRRYAPTPSYARVTEKPDDRSIGRHQRFAEHLQPFLTQLAPQMRLHGYQW